MVLRPVLVVIHGYNEDGSLDWGRNFVKKKANLIFLSLCDRPRAYLPFISYNCHFIIRTEVAFEKLPL